MLLDWQSLLELVGMVGAAAVGLRVLWGLFNWVCKKIKSMIGIAALKQDIAIMSEQLLFVVSELKPNGGSSIKDTMTRIEEGLNLSNERQRARMSDSPELIFETDAAGNCIWVNRTYARTVQRLPAELMGHGWVNAIVPVDRDRVVSEWYKSVEEDREFEMQFKLQAPDGIPFTVDCRSYKMRDCRSKKAIGYLGHCELV